MSIRHKIKNPMHIKWLDNKAAWQTNNRKYASYILNIKIINHKKYTVKSKLSSPSGSVTLRQLNLIH